MFVQHCLDKNWLIMVISILKLSMLACLSSIYCSLGILLLLQFQLNCKYMSSLHFQVMAIVSFAAGFSHNATKVTGERINFHFKWRFFIHIKKNFIWNGDRASEEMQQYHCFNGNGNGNGLLFHMTQPISRSTTKAIACSKPTISEHQSK